MNLGLDHTECSGYNKTRPWHDNVVPTVCFGLGIMMQCGSTRLCCGIMRLWFVFMKLHWDILKLKYHEIFRLCYGMMK